MALFHDPPILTVLSTVYSCHGQMTTSMYKSKFLSCRKYLKDSSGNLGECFFYILLAAIMLVTEGLVPRKVPGTALIKVQRHSIEA